MGDERSVDGFDHYLAAEGCAARTRRKYLWVVRSWQASGLPLSEWASGQLAAVPSGTAGVLRAALRHWSLYAGEGVLSLPRGRRTKRQYRRPLSAAELAAYYRRVKHGRMSPAIKVILLLLPRTGLRIHEACQLTLDDYDQRSRSRALRVLGKGEHYRAVPLTEESARVLGEYLDTRAPAVRGPSPIFPGARPGTSLTPDAVRVVLRRVRGQSTHITPHVLRHTFATRFYDATGDLLLLSQILGHDSLETTRRYVQGTLHRALQGMEAAELPPPAKPKPKPKEKK